MVSNYLKLRLAGIKIYSSAALSESEEEKEEWFDFGLPILRIIVLSLYADHGDLSYGAFYINLSLLEAATFDREPNNRGSSKRWESYQLVILGERKYSYLRDIISDGTDKFIIEYLKANPK